MKKTIRLQKETMKQGIDGCEFELALTGKDLPDLREQPLINQQGKCYGTVSVYKGKASIKLCLPKAIRANNIQPFTLSDCIALEFIKNDCENRLYDLFGGNPNTEISKIEVNITQKVSGQATQSEVLNLLSHAALSDGSDNIKYVGKNKRDIGGLKEEIHTVIKRKSHYWVAKMYDKTEEQIKERLANNLPVDDVPDGLLRIEFILIDRTLKKLFSSKRKLSNILTKNSLIKVMKEYKRIFCEELVNEMIKPYLNKCTKKVYESLLEVESVSETIALHGECILDYRILKKALKLWYENRGIINNSARDAKRYAKKYNLPIDVIVTIKDFKKSCG